jgi:hypothetical protein
MCVFSVAVYLCQPVSPSHTYTVQFVSMTLANSACCHVLHLSLPFLTAHVMSFDKKNTLVFFAQFYILCVMYAHVNSFQLNIVKN